MPEEDIMERRLAQLEVMMMLHNQKGDWLHDQLSRCVREGNFSMWYVDDRMDNAPLLRRQLNRLRYMWAGEDHAIAMHDA